MATNQILPFGTAAGANVLSPAEYQSLATRAGGFQSGVAKSKELNTVWRQVSFAAAMLGQFIADTSGIDVLDDGDIPGLKADFIAALRAYLQSQVASTAQAQASSDDSVLLTPKKLADSLKGANQLFGTSGYQKLPGGLIIQWGAVDANSSGVYTTWPVSFPTACRRVVCSHSSGGGAVASSSAATTVSGGTFYLSTTSGLFGTVNYIAIGD